MIITSRKLAVSSRTLCLNCDTRTSTTVIASDSAAAMPGRRDTINQKKLRTPQASAKISFGTIPTSVATMTASEVGRSEEHTSELQSRQYLVCRLLLEKKKKYLR